MYLLKKTPVASTIKKNTYYWNNYFNTLLDRKILRFHRSTGVLLWSTEVLLLRVLGCYWKQPRVVFLSFKPNKKPIIKSPKFSEILFYIILLKHNFFEIFDLCNSNKNRHSFIYSQLFVNLLRDCGNIYSRSYIYFRQRQFMPMVTECIVTLMDIFVAVMKFLPSIYNRRWQCHVFCVPSL